MNDDFTLGVIMQLHGGQDMTRSELVELLRRKSVDPIIVEYIARLYDHKFSKKRSGLSLRITNVFAGYPKLSALPCSKPVKTLSGKKCTVWLHWH